MGWESGEQAEANEVIFRPARLRLDPAPERPGAKRVCGAVEQAQDDRRCCDQSSQHRAGLRGVSEGRVRGVQEEEIEIPSAPALRSKTKLPEEGAKWGSRYRQVTRAPDSERQRRESLQRPEEAPASRRQRVRLIVLQRGRKPQGKFSSDSIFIECGVPRRGTGPPCSSGGKCDGDLILCCDWH